MSKIFCILCLLFCSCALFSPTSKPNQEGIRNKQIINDPKTMNILAWFVGGSLLLGSVGAYVKRKRNRINRTL